MNRSLLSHLSICFGLCLLLCGSHFVNAATLTVELQTTAMHYPVFVPSPAPTEATPALKETRFPLEKAINFQELAASLSPEQKKALEQHRFLLLPAGPGTSWRAAYSCLWDEMLCDLTAIGGSPQKEERKPENTILVTPDPFLHALHKYVSERLKEVEANVLEPALQRYLAAMYDNILRLKAQAAPGNASDWERLQAKMLVPLLLIRNSEGAKELKYYEEPDEAKRDQADQVDTLDNAIKRLGEYRSGLNPKTATAVEDTLRLIYEATFAGSTPATDYTRYRPRGHYEATAHTRSYFRAMMYLGATGWHLTPGKEISHSRATSAMMYLGTDGFMNGTNETDMTDAVNFALAMSLPLAPNPTAKAGQGGMDPIENWRTIMSISALYAGYPDEACYPEWVEYVRAHIGGKLTPDSASDPAVIAALSKDLDQFKTNTPFFKKIWPPGQTPILRVFPQRFTAAWLVADNLTAKPFGEDKKLPATFSGLWMPLVFGSEYAAGLLPEQTRLLLSRKATATEAIGPAEKKEVSVPTEAVEDAVKVLRQRADALRADMKSVPEESWFSSIGAAWLYLLRTQTATYGQGYPLYMRDPAFAAKQLQTYMGSYTELKHDMLLYEKPNYAEAGEGAEGEIPPVPKGFVEPNLPFWHELLRVTRMLQVIEGARPEEVEKNIKERAYGGLANFAWQIELCINLAEKELGNQPISDEEYENLRTGMNLDYMAEPEGGARYSDPDQYLSGLIVDVQTNLEDNLIVYEATAAPQYMLALVGNEDSPRLVLGVVYNHHEFTAPYGPRFTDKQWKQRVYHEKATLPAKNFWYDALK